MQSHKLRTHGFLFLSCFLSSPKHPTHSPSWIQTSPLFVLGQFCAWFCVPTCAFDDFSHTDGLLVISYLPHLCPPGPPLPPQDVQVLCGQAPGVLQVHWKPPILSPTGTSNGANVVGYAVCTKGQRVCDQLALLMNSAEWNSIKVTT